MSQPRHVLRVIIRAIVTLIVRYTSETSDVGSAPPSLPRAVSMGKLGGSHLIYGLISVQNYEWYYIACFGMATAWLHILSLHYRAVQFLLKCASLVDYEQT